MNSSLSNDSRPRSMIDWVAGRRSLIAPPGGFFLASGPTGDDDGTLTPSFPVYSARAVSLMDSWLLAFRYKYPMDTQASSQRHIKATQPRVPCAWWVVSCG